MVWGGEIVYGLQPWDTEARKPLELEGERVTLSGDITYIEAKGEAHGVKRRLLAEVERSSGNLKGIFDLILFGGKEISPSP